jgi:hypothetical protein
MPKKTDKILMSKASLASEHKKLISLLRHGTRPQLLKEATAQAKEAVKYKK